MGRADRDQRPEDLRNRAGHNRVDLEDRSRRVCPDHREDRVARSSLSLGDRGDQRVRQDRDRREDRSRRKDQ